MFAATHLIGFGAGGDVTYGLGSAISGGTGSNIGDFTVNTANAFDGTTSQNFSNSARTATGVTSGYIGKDYSSSAKRIYKVVITGGSDSGLEGNGGNSVTINLTLYGKNGSSPSNGTDGTSLGTASPSDSDGGTFTVNNSGDLSQLWDYVWVYYSHASQWCVAAEVVFHEAVPV